MKKEHESVNPEKIMRVVDVEARRRLVEFSQQTIEDEGEEMVLEEVFLENIGDHWPRRLKRELKSARKDILQKMRDEELDPRAFENPVEMLVNTVAISALEKMLVAAGVFESLEDVRENSEYAEPGLESKLSDEEPDSDDGTQSPIYTPDL